MRSGRGARVNAAGRRLRGERGGKLTTKHTKISKDRPRSRRGRQAGFTSRTRRNKPASEARSGRGAPVGECLKIKVAGGFCGDDHAGKLELVSDERLCE
jgi:hypothetical protein